MIGRIVEIADDRRHLSKWRGFLVVRESGKEFNELGRVPLDDIAAVVANAHGLTYTNNLLVALASQGCPFVLCGANHNAVGMLLPIDGNFEQARRFDAQLSATKPLIKSLWACVVRSKLEQQARTLVHIGVSDAFLRVLVRRVRSGDPDNIEAQAARRYWSLLFGSEFRRDQNGDGINGLLNYGYTILRSMTARSVVAAGLHPTVGLHHSNAGNPMRLVDDLMEPFRPIVDVAVWQLTKRDRWEVDAETKRELVHCMYWDVETRSGRTPLMVCVQRLAISLAQIFLKQRKDLDLPGQFRPSVGVADDDAAC